MISDKIAKMLNNQINQEFYSSYLYLQMGAFFEEEKLNGFAAWMKIQSHEEGTHAMKLYEYVLRANAKVELQKIEAPKNKWKDTLDVFQDTYKHEKQITSYINGIVDNALTEKDFATFSFLQWFVTEQVEEESTALLILDKIKLIGDNKTGLFFLDREMSGRAKS
ncbi:MAG: ferritin [Ignavibacteriaceae bacterium]|nr:ferritin [Ignavibacteriaceae bacterium]